MSVESVYDWGPGEVPTGWPLEKVLFFAGEASLRNKLLSFSGPEVPARFGARQTPVAVFRFSPAVLRRVLSDTHVRDGAIARIQQEIGALRRRFERDVEMQLDADCPTELLDEYAQLVGMLAESCDARLSVTMIASWLQPKIVGRFLELPVDLYVMLYTMGPAAEYQKWRGEVPRRLWTQALDDLKKCYVRHPQLSERMVVVLPVYDLVTVYSQDGQRRWRASAADWAGHVIATNERALLQLEPAETSAFGTVNVWQVTRTGAYGGTLMRAGSRMILERFDSASLQSAVADLQKNVPQLKRFGVFHIGGIRE